MIDSLAADVTADAAPFHAVYESMREQKINRARGFHRPSEIHPVDIYQTGSNYHQWLVCQLNFYGVSYNPHLSVFRLELLYMQQFVDKVHG